jgi:hypothetical protein
MQVVNKVIEVTQSNENDKLERTTKEIFTEFNEKLFWITQEPTYQNLINKSMDEGQKKAV